MDGVRVELPGGDWATDIVVSNGNVMFQEPVEQMLATGSTKPDMTFLEMVEKEKPSLSTVMIFT